MEPVLLRRRSRWSRILGCYDLYTLCRRVGLNRRLAWSLTWATVRF